MKIKMPTAEGGMKTMLAHHVEKIIFGVVALLSLILLFSGFRARQVVDTSQTPEDLKAKVSQARSFVDQFNWEEHFRNQRDLPQRYLERVDGLSQPVAVSDYALSQLVRPPFVPPRSLRKDPVLLAPVQLRSVAGHGVLALSRQEAGNNPNAIDPSQLVRNEFADNQRTISDPFISVDSEAAGRGVYFVAVTALVPQRQQLQHYFDALANSEEYDDERDRPNYLGFILERAEVPADGSAPENWTILGRPVHLERAKAGWAGTVNLQNQPVDPKFTHEKLTSELPPIKGFGDQTAWIRLASHPGLPVDQPELAAEPSAPDAPPNAAERSENLFSFGSPPDRTGSGSSAPHPTAPTQVDPTNARPSTAEGRAQLLESTPEYLLIRYFDMSVEPGKTYQYRMQLGLEDPNNPQDDKPPSRSLEPEVAERVTAAPGQTFRITENSDPSAPVTVHLAHKALAGTVTVPEKLVMRGSTEPFLPVGEEPSARVVGVEFDAAAAAEKAISLDVRRGSVLNGSTNVQVFLPISGRIGRLEGAAVSTNTVVVDFAGGEPIGTTKLIEPGRVLLWKADGSFAVARELQDAAELQQYQFTAAAAPTAPPPRNERPERPTRQERPEPRRRTPSVLNFGSGK